MNPFQCNAIKCNIINLVVLTSSLPILVKLIQQSLLDEDGSKLLCFYRFAWLSWFGFFSLFSSLFGLFCRCFLKLQCIEFSQPLCNLNIHVARFHFTQRHLFSFRLHSLYNTSLRLSASLFKQPSSEWAKKKIPFNIFALFTNVGRKLEWFDYDVKMLHFVLLLHILYETCVPADGQGAVDGGPFGLGYRVKWVAVTVANHHLDRQQLVVCRTVTCQRRLPSASTCFQCNK